MTTAALIAWISVCAAGFTWIQARGSTMRVAHPLAMVVVVATVARIVPLLILREPSGRFAIDIGNYRIVADAVLGHRDVFAINIAILYIHPYLPFQMYVVAVCLKLAHLTGVSFFVIVRLPAVAADVVTTMVLFRGLERMHARASLRDALSYAACPLPIFVTAYHGQFDAISVMFVCLSWYVFSAPDRTSRGVLVSAALLGFAILDKSWPIVLLPVFALHLTNTRDRLAYVSATIAVPVLAVVTYLAAFPASFDALRERATGYRAPLLDGQTYVIDHLLSGFPGATSFLDWEIEHAQVMVAAGVALGMLAALRVNLATGLVAMVAATLVTTTNGGSNHALWIVPLALIAGQRGWFIASSAVAAANYALSSFVFCGISCGSIPTPFEYFWVDALTWITVLQWLTLAAWLANLLANPRHGEGDGWLTPTRPPTHARM